MPALSDHSLQAIGSRQRRLAMLLTLTMIAIYFGFILLVAFDKPLLATKLTPGLSLGIVLGALVIVSSWLLTLFYVRWANTHYDGAIDRGGK